VTGYSLSIAFLNKRPPIFGGLLPGYFNSRCSGIRKWDITTGRPREEVSQFFKQFPQIAPFFDFVITGENFKDHENNENFETSYQTFAPDSYRTKAKQIYTESAARGHRIKDYFLLKYFGLIADDCQDMASALQEIHPFEKIRVYSIPECGENTSCEESLGYTFHRLTSDLEFEF